MNDRRSRIFLCLLWLLLIGDLSFSFYQFYGMGLDGDLAGIVAPSEHYTDMLSDPFGWSVLTEGAVYAAPNRYFVHRFMVAWFGLVPEWFGQLFDPVDALFLAIASFKFLLQGALIVMGVRFLRLFSPDRASSFWDSFPLLALLLFPFFQNGFLNPVMGIIQASPTYSFFYALPMLLVLLWWYPLLRSRLTGRKIAPLTLLWLLPLSIALPFTGPLVAGVLAVLIFTSLAARLLSGPETIYVLLRRRSTLILLGTALLCLYSVYIGTHNAENLTDALPLAQRYARLPWGVYYLFQIKLGFSLLAVTTLGLAIWMFRKHHDTRLARCGMFLLLFALLYLLLLPLGGYRAYRSHIVRADTFLPVTLVLVFYFALLVRYLIGQLQGRSRMLFGTFVGLVLLYFTLCDEPKVYTNPCERVALRRIAEAESGPVRLDEGCHVLSWNPDHDPAATYDKARFLQKVGVLDSLRLWYVPR